MLCVGLGRRDGGASPPGWRKWRRTSKHCARETPASAASLAAAEERRARAPPARVPPPRTAPPPPAAASLASEGAEGS
eukprot:5549134-Prymnesium_polylepis.1